MMKNINEINRLLLAISELSGGKNNAVPASAVIRQCRNTVLMGSLPDHKDTIDFCIELKIIRIEKNRLKVEYLGKSSLMQIQVKITNLQKIKKILLQENLFSIRYFLKIFLRLSSLSMQMKNLVHLYGLIVTESQSKETEKF